MKSVVVVSLTLLILCTLCWVKATYSQNLEPRQEVLNRQDRIKNILARSLMVSENTEEEMHESSEWSLEELERLTEDVTKFFCRFMGCLYGSVCKLKPVSEIVADGSIEKLEKSVLKIISTMNDSLAIESEYKTVMELMDNFELTKDNIRLLEDVFYSFENIADHQQADYLNSAMQEVVSRIVECDCIYGMTGIRCDQCTFGARF